MKINRLEHTKSLYPHFFDKTDDSNFTKHLKIVGERQQDIRHKLKTVDWSRILEKPLQIWKTQTEPYVYDMNFKVQVPYLKEINVYKNPILNDKEEIIAHEQVDNPNDELGRVIHQTYDNDNVRFFEKTVRNIQTSEGMIIPSDTYVLEVITWDDYRFVKGYPENDYTVKEDNTLQYRYNETFLSIKVEEISYSKYLTFRVHKDKIKEIQILKNDSLLLRQTFETDRIRKASTLLNSISYYYDEEYTNETTYGQSDYRGFYDIEDEDTNNIRQYYSESHKDEYFFRLPLTDDDFIINFDEDYILENANTLEYIVVDELSDSLKEMDGLIIVKDGDKYRGYVVSDNEFDLVIPEVKYTVTDIVKDVYDLTVYTFETRYRCLHEYNRVYTKRYNGYDTKTNDCFDHDYSLDIIGNLLNIHRFRFYQVSVDDIEHLSRTYPTFYNRSTEDDYTYMKRIQFYISNYNHIVFPVLEFWKYYTIFPNLKSRKKIIGEMDRSYIRTTDTDGYICSDDTPFTEEEFETEDIVEYSLNKATNINSTSNYISLGNGWYEATVVKDVYVVPSTDYLLRYVVDRDDVTIRLICYNRKGKELRTTPIPLEDSDYTIVEETYNVIKTINVPKDTVSIKIVLESNNSFSFESASFERITVVNFDTDYMVTEYEYNSNFYELYVNYEDIPSNIRIGGGERFKILLKRSLPLTKTGLLYMDVTEPINDNIHINDDYKIYLYNILNENQRTRILTMSHNHYDETITNCILPNKEYNLKILFEMTPEDDFEDKTMSVLLEFYDENNTKIITEEEYFDDTFYSDTEAEIQYGFTTPEGTSYVRLQIIAQTTTELNEIRISRIEELSINEMT